MTSHENWSNEHVLQRLATPAAGEAWKVFLRRHTSLIVSVARHYHHDEQRLRDCYLFVCEKLCDDGFRRLLAYRQADNVQFSSWLRAVVANLCVDWLRAEFGRQGRFRAIAKLPELEQEVYAHRFEQGLSIAACYEAIRVRFPDLTEVQLAGVIRRLNRKLTPRQHWLLATRGRITVSFDDPEVQGEASLLNAGGDDPENRAVSDEQQRRVNAALRQLEPQQRLLLQLRYQQGLTLQEVARLAGFDDLFRARYLVQQALARLQALLRD